MLLASLSAMQQGGRAERSSKMGARKAGKTWRPAGAYRRRGRQRNYDDFDDDINFSDNLTDSDEDGDEVRVESFGM